MTLRYVLTNVRPGTGISDICDELKPRVDGVIDAKGGALLAAGAEELEPHFDDAEEPLKVKPTSTDASATAGGPDLTSDSDAASAPSAPGQVL